MLNKSPSAQGPKIIKASSWAFQVMKAYTCPAARTSLIPSRLSSHGTFVVFSFHFFLSAFFFSLFLPFQALSCSKSSTTLMYRDSICPFPASEKKRVQFTAACSIWDMSPMDDKNSLCIFEYPEPQILATQHTQASQITQRTWRKIKLEMVSSRNSRRMSGP